MSEQGMGEMLHVVLTRISQVICLSAYTAILVGSIWNAWPDVHFFVSYTLYLASGLGGK